jgi:hypothetical protein
MNPETAQFCEECGAPLDGQRPPQQQQTMPPVPPLAKAKKKRSKLLPALAIVLGSLVLLIGGIVGAVKVVTVLTAKTDFYQLGKEKIPAMRYVLNNTREVTGVRKSVSNGEREQEVTYTAEGTAIEDVAFYVDYLTVHKGYSLLSPYDQTQLSGTVSLGRSAKTAGYKLLVQVTYDQAGYVIKAACAKGSVTPEATLPNPYGETTVPYYDIPPAAPAEGETSLPPGGESETTTEPEPESSTQPAAAPTDPVAAERPASPEA